MRFSCPKIEDLAVREMKLPSCPQELSERALARLALAFITLLGVAFHLEMSFLAAVAAALVFFHHVDTERLVLHCDTLNHAHVFGDELEKVGIPGLSVFVNHFCKLILDVLTKA